MASKIQKKVVVLGASFSGLVTAKVLSEFYEQVVIIEKGADVTSPKSRSVVPQMGQHHILLAEGRRILESIFPGIDNELDSYGSELIDYTLDGKLFTEYGQCPRFKSNILIRPSSRVLLDFLLRQRVRKVSNISIEYHSKWLNLILSKNNSTVSGLTYIQDEKIRVLNCDTLIDCTGRNSILSKILEKNGFDVPTPVKVNPFVGYATCAYEIEDDLVDFKLMEIASSAPHNPRAAGLWKIEGNKWLLALIGSNKVYPSSDPSEYLDFASKLEQPDIYRIVKEAKAISDISLYRGPVNQWRQYSKMKDFPVGLLVLGDALATFNPLYGQGMSIALSEILVLKNTLIKKNLIFNRVLQSKINKTVNLAWPLAIAEDLKWSMTEGSKVTFSDKLSIWYSNLLLPLSRTNKRVVETFLQIANLQKGPYSLISPAILKDVFLFYFHKKEREVSRLCSRRIEELVEEYGIHTNSHMSLQSDIQYFENKELGVVLYKKHRSIFGNINIVFINPLCDDSNLEALLYDFEMNTSGKFLYIGNDQKVANVLKTKGYSINEFGSEFNIDLSEFKVSGKRMKYLRNVQNLGSKGLFVEEKKWEDVDSVAVRDISSHWMGKKKVKNGELKLLTAPPRFFESWKERKFYCYEDGRMIAYVFFIPYFKKGELFGYCAHILRSMPGTTSGSLDFIVLKAIEKFKEEGVSELSLGIAPLHDIEKINGDDSLTRKVLETFYKHGNFLYSFKALAFHKERYRGNKVKMYYCSKNISLIRSVWAILLKTGIIKYGN